MTAPLQREGRSTRGIRLTFPVLVGLILVAVLTGAAAVYFAPFGSKVPTIVRGTVTAASGDATQIGLRIDESAGSRNEGIGFEIAGAYWIDRDGRVHDGSHPTCIVPGSTGQRIELAYVQVRAIDDSPGHNTLVAWVRCL
ncbi:hypothetical protein [Streptosporangium pseudovulgare]|nr:hypothetical protein [Streptosporangium pseudovulgare]